MLKLTSSLYQLKQPQNSIFLKKKNKQKQKPETILNV